MKKKILTFIIGFLAGAIIATAGFLIYNKTISNNTNQSEMIQMNERGPMQQPSNGNMSGNMEEPPEKPNGENGEEPPAKPDDSNNNVNS